MANVIKVVTTKPLPPDAVIVTRRGQQYVRRKVRGRAVNLPVTECGTKYHLASAKWYVRYKDEQGKWQKRPGYTDKEATLQLAAEIERTIERRKAGLIEPHLDFHKRSLLEHLSDFKTYLLAQEDTNRHVNQTHNRIRRLLEGCNCAYWSDLDPNRVVIWLAEQRKANRISIKTSNYYLAAVKHFVQWVGKRSGENPLAEITSLKADADVRRQRRTLSPDAFARLIDAAIIGPPIQCVFGIDRAMLYIVAAWTGYRCGELASITVRSFNFLGQPATVDVQAAYSKRRKKEAIPLHPDLVSRLQQWLATKSGVSSGQPLFNLRTAGGGLRRTAKMMRIDLESARAKWTEEAKDDQEERKKREESDYLCYQDEDGLYADFHANRHIFISNLSKAGIGPKMAQSLARHSNIDLTMNTYTHLEMNDRAMAINGLPAPPLLEPSVSAESKPPEKFAHMFAKPPASGGINCPPQSQEVQFDVEDDADAETKKPLSEQGFVTPCHLLATGDESSGGGTRTPDKRIMIPLL